MAISPRNKIYTTTIADNVINAATFLEKIIMHYVICLIYNITINVHMVTIFTSPLSVENHYSFTLGCAYFIHCGQANMVHKWLYLFRQYDEYKSACVFIMTSANPSWKWRREKPMQNLQIHLPTHVISLCRCLWVFVSVWDCLTHFYYLTNHMVIAFSKTGTWTTFLSVLGFWWTECLICNCVYW